MAQQRSKPKGLAAGCLENTNANRAWQECCLAAFHRAPVRRPRAKLDEGRGGLL